ncbi:membrane protein [Leadbettera azotonutricia]|uniref:Putative polymorphic outer membrane protein n=1 Tax=Leadbettera azotonutricia (strain ATCC BAA-888 / DSM 13862 / ZAS-9) TaxID=545695 RepID=F5Y7F9_LEAAZ|nr:membrane protein [Leadbettera azotonutricia]AEF80583.1 putative polymorphic outer membrane protein [Leadbettera azotonutricia ZAS-9]
MGTVTVLLAEAVFILAACEYSVSAEDSLQNPVPGDGAMPVAWFVADTPWGEPSGAPARKAKTIKEGLSQIRAAYKSGAFADGKRAVVVIEGIINLAGEGVLSNKSLVSITGEDEYPPIVLRGGGSGGVLDGENQVRVLYVESNNVTIADGLTLTRGNSKTHNEMYGGGVYLEKSHLTMTGGTISDSTAELGSGVFIFEDKESKHSSFDMRGGTIKGGSGPAVYIDNGCFFTLSDSGLITENGPDGSTGEGGGVQINGHGTFFMLGGTIKGNRTTSYGGGVRVSGNSTFFMRDGLITENTAPDNCGSGVYVSKYGGVLIQTGGIINGNYGTPEIVQ